MKGRQSISCQFCGGIVHAVAFPSYLTVDATHVYFLAGSAQILRAPR